jgi:hypothetical protein
VKILGSSFGEFFGSGYASTVWLTDDASVAINSRDGKVSDGSFQSKDGKITETLGEKPK